MNHTVVLAPHRSRIYDQIVALRHEVLRKPLGLVFTQEQLDAEATYVHMGLVVDGQIRAALYLVNEGNGVIRMRQVAVAFEFQGEGLGRELVFASEQTAGGLGAEEMILDARESAIPFYLRIGYETYGEPFEQVGMQHMKMRKRLKERG